VASAAGGRTRGAHPPRSAFHQCEDALAERLWLWVNYGDSTGRITPKSLGLEQHACRAVQHWLVAIPFVVKQVGARCLHLVTIPRIRANLLSDEQTQSLRHWVLIGIACRPAMRTARIGQIEEWLSNTIGHKKT